MSRFASKRLERLTPYVPGEQPRERGLVKLNTNEAPFPPPRSVLDVIRGAAAGLNLYSDPDGARLRSALAEYHGVTAEFVSLGNGSDETLSFIFAALLGGRGPVVFPDITYGFYPVFADFYGIPYTELPVRRSCAVDCRDYVGIGRDIVLANPNAPTGVALGLDKLEELVSSNPDNIVVIDEAYADFWGRTAIPMTARYGNLVVTRTYSKSRFLAGARLGYCVASPELTADIERARFAFNPYNVNALTLAAGERALSENEYYTSKWREITDTRDWAQERLSLAGFDLTDSKANFVFASHPEFTGAYLYKQLRERGFLTRRLDRLRIRDWLRITIGTRADMERFIDALQEIIAKPEV
jgi:histidinol-phosphate aminotransferase